MKRERSPHTHHTQEGHPTERKEREEEEEESKRRRRRIKKAEERSRCGVGTIF